MSVSEALGSIDRQPTTPAPSAAQAAQNPPAEKPSSFHTLLSELNPLQYLPVIGTLYRSLTGDTIPEPVRVIGSLIVSGLIGGPAGVATSLAALGAEKAMGLDPERIGHGMLASVGIVTPDPAASSTTAPTGWSPSQRAAYGVAAIANAVPQNNLLVAALRPTDPPQGVGRG